MERKDRGVVGVWGSGKGEEEGHMHFCWNTEGVKARTHSGPYFESLRVPKIFKCFRLPATHSPSGKRVRTVLTCQLVKRQPGSGNI